MLKAPEVENKKEHQVLMVNKTTSLKEKGKGKKPKFGPKPETECFYCKQTGHWKRNCPQVFGG